MTFNPGIRSKVGCGGVILLVLAVPWLQIFVFDLLTGGDPRVSGAYEEGGTFRVGGLWWLFIILAALSVVAVFRLAFGFRDWLGPFLAAAWTGIGITIGLETDNFRGAWAAGLSTVLLTAAVWRDRRRMNDEYSETD